MISSLNQQQTEVTVTILAVLGIVVEVAKESDQLLLVAHFFYSALLFFFSKLIISSNTAAGYLLP